jgi:hypothetical protein
MDREGYLEGLVEVVRGICATHWPDCQCKLCKGLAKLDGHLIK